MLIVTDRHTKEDLEAWQSLEEADLVYYHTHNMEARINQAIKSIRDFTDGTDCYISVSWGKDSITVLHLAILAGIEINVVCSRGTYTTVAANDIYIDKVKELFTSIYNINYEEIIYPEYPPKSKQKSLRNYENHKGIYKHISGVRSAESSMRKKSRSVHGISTEKSCRPIIDWSTEAVFAYCAFHKLPLHPNYGFLSGWIERHRIRVGGSIGGEDGVSHGREEWEKMYYKDVLRKIEYNRMIARRK